MTIKQLLELSPEEICEQYIQDLKDVIEELERNEDGN